MSTWHLDVLAQIVAVVEPFHGEGDTLGWFDLHCLGPLGPFHDFVAAYLVPFRVFRHQTKVIGVGICQRSGVDLLEEETVLLSEWLQEVE